MRLIALRFLNSMLTISLLYSIGQANLQYQIKINEAELFRTSTLEPPPLAVLHQSDELRLINRGPTQSLVQTEGGIKGWIRNQDLLALKPASGGEYQLNSQRVNAGGDVNISPYTQSLPTADFELEAINRSFANDRIEPMDREQLEMRHNEN